MKRRLGRTPLYFGIGISTFLAISGFLMWLNDDKQDATMLYASLFFLFCLATMIFDLKRKLKPASIAPKSSSSYVVRLDEFKIEVMQLKGNQVVSIQWDEVKAVYIVAQDAFPVGDIYWMLCDKKQKAVTIPWDADRGDLLLSAMQERLTEFDNQKVIEASSMLEGVICVWEEKRRIQSEYYSPTES